MKKEHIILISGITLLVIGVLVIPIAVILPVLLNSTENNQFLIPGERQVDVEEGRYYLWNDFQTVFNNESYNRSESIPDGVKILILDKEGNEFNLISDASISMSKGASSKRSIGYVDISETSVLSIKVESPHDERVFSFSQSVMLKIIGLFLGGIAMSLLVTTAGIGVSVWGIVRLANESKKG